MIDFKELRRRCASCPKGDYWRCRKCWIWKALNTACDFCSKKGGVVPFVRFAVKGFSEILVCEKCLEKLT
jgi:hypothetical protein